MAYKIAGNELTLQPTAGGWIIPDALGYGISGMARYPAIFQYELVWDLMPMSDFNQLHQLYENQSLTGTYVVELPDIEDSEWVFREFSGTIIDYPVVGQYFLDHLESVSLRIRNIRK